MSTTIQQLIQATHDIIDGQIAQPIDVTSDDEVGQLAASFNRMVEISMVREEEARRHVEKLQQMNSELTRTNHIQSEFLSDVSHELRTPLTSIKSFCDLLLMFGDDDPEARDQFLNNIIDSCDRLMGLINQLLDSSKMGAGKVEWELTEVDLIEIIKSSVGTMKAMADGKGVQLISELSLESITVEADRDRIIQVLTNLINNALKFTEEGQVTVEVELMAHEVKVNISDSGIGIAPENLDLIFERFAQIKTTEAGKPSGTGLGLAICREIIDHHGGRIWAESEFGEGTTFSFTLPIPADG